MIKYYFKTCHTQRLSRSERSARVSYQESLSMIQLNFPQIKIIAKNFSNNQFLNSSGDELVVSSPYNNSPIGQLQTSTLKDCEQIINNAEVAFKEWGTTPIKERTQILFRWREELLRDQKNIANQVSLESGKTPQEALAGLMKGIEVLEFALSLQNTMQNKNLEVSKNVFCEDRRSPVGITLGITPFNFPAMVPMWMMPITLACGNVFIWKPSEKTPLTANLIAEASIRAGFPPGVLNIIHGNRETVEILLKHPKISAIAFVGSSPAAENVYQKGTHAGKRVLALGGAKNHLFLLPDADPEIAGEGVANSFTGCAGQRCMAGSVLLAIGKVDHLIERIISEVKKIVPSKNMGAIINQESLTRLTNAIEKADKNDFKIILDGRNPVVASPYQKGNWLAPTVIDHVQPGSFAACDELFGPILSIIRCKNIDEALDIENSTIYGNATSVFTRDGGLAEYIVSKSSSGMIGINIGVPVPREPFSFGGTKASRFGHGDITGYDGVNFWTQIKKVTKKWSMEKDRSWLS